MYGRNLEFRIFPLSKNRSGRVYNSETTAVPNGAPVLVDHIEGENAVQQSALAIAANGTARPLPGEGGIILQEYGFDAINGYDPSLTVVSDFDTVAPAKACQMISGTEVTVVLRNTVDRTFLNTRAYAGRKMVDGLGGATPAVNAGDYLGPGTGNDTNGYWEVVADAADAWMVVTRVEHDRDELEARLLF